MSAGRGHGEQLIAWWETAVRNGWKRPMGADTRMPEGLAAWMFMHYMALIVTASGAAKALGTAYGTSANKRREWFLDLACVRLDEDSGRVEKLPKRHKGWGSIDPNAIQRGHAFEDAILQWVRRRTGFDCREFAMLQDPTCPHRYATPDFVVYHPRKKGVVIGCGQIKCRLNLTDRKGSTLVARLYEWIQVTREMDVSGCEWSIIAVAWVNDDADRLAHLDDAGGHRMKLFVYRYDPMFAARIRGSLDRVVALATKVRRGLLPASVALTTLERLFQMSPITRDMPAPVPYDPRIHGTGFGSDCPFNYSFVPRPSLRRPPHSSLFTPSAESATLEWKKRGLELTAAVDDGGDGGSKDDDDDEEEEEDVGAEVRASQRLKIAATIGIRFFGNATATVDEAHVYFDRMRRCSTCAPAESTLRSQRRIDHDQHGTKYLLRGCPEGESERRGAVETAFSSQSFILRRHRRGRGRDRDRSQSRGRSRGRGGAGAGAQHGAAAARRQRAEAAAGGPIAGGCGGGRCTDRSCLGWPGLVSAT